MAIGAPPGMQMPAIPPPQGVGGAPGAAPGGAPNPMAMLMQRGAQQQGGAGGMNPGQQAMLMFLAGMGFDKFAAALDKLRGPKDGSHHKQTGLQKDAAMNPAMVPAAQLQQQLQQLAQRQAMGGAPPTAPQMPPGIMPPGMSPPSGTPF